MANLIFDKAQIEATIDKIVESHDADGHDMGLALRCCLLRHLRGI